MIEEFKESLLIIITTPVYLLLIGIEMVMSSLHNKSFYTTKDTLTNVYLMTLNLILDILFRGICNKQYSFGVLLAGWNAK